MIEAIVETIRNERVDRLPGHIRSEAVLLDIRVKDVEQRIRFQEKAIVYIVLLWGMGGIGKSTLARAMFDRHRTRFKEASYVENCGEQKASQIQDSLRYDLLRDKAPIVGDSSRQRKFLRESLIDKEVLIVLDDMKEDSHFCKT